MVQLINSNRNAANTNVQFDRFLEDTRQFREIYQFTERETEILWLVACGFQAKEIALQLNVSTRTVETHKHNLFRKTGRRSALKLVRDIYSL